MGGLGEKTFFDIYTLPYSHLGIMDSIEENHYIILVLSSTSTKTEKSLIWLVWIILWMNEISDINKYIKCINVHLCKFVKYINKHYEHYDQQMELLVYRTQIRPAWSGVMEQRHNSWRGDAELKLYVHLHALTAQVSNLSRKGRCGCRFSSQSSRSQSGDGLTE